MSQTPPEERREQSRQQTRKVFAGLATPSYSMRLSSLRYESSRYNEAALLEATGKAVESPRAAGFEPPETGTQVFLSIDGRRVGAAGVEESYEQENGEVFIRAFDAIRPLNQTSLNRHFEDTDAATVAGVACDTAGVDYRIQDSLVGEARSISRLERKQDIYEAQQAAEYRREAGGGSDGGDGGGGADDPDLAAIIQAYDEEGPQAARRVAGIEGEFEDPDLGAIINAYEEGGQEAARAEADDPDTDELSEATMLVSQAYDGTACTDIVAEMARRLDAAWWVDGQNTVRIASVPNTESHTVGAVLTHSAGSQQAPYTKVVVEGGQQTTGSGGSGALSKETIRATAGDEDASANQTRQYEAPTITSESMAQNVANALLAEYEKQQASGTVELVGDSRLRPLDVIRTPDTEYFSGQRFLVSAVTHTVDDQGYKTRVQCGSLEGQQGGGSSGGGGGGGNGGGNGNGNSNSGSGGGG